MSRIIPKEALANVRRWQIGDFDGRPPKSAVPVTPVQPPPDIAPLLDMPAEATVNLPTAEEIEQIHEQARREGYDAGLAEGQAAAESAANAAREQEIAHFQTLTANYRAALEGLDQGVAEQLLDLALEVASQVLRTTLETRRDALLPIIREAIQALPLHHGTITLHLNPDDAEALQEALGELSGQANLHLAPDSEITRGGCLLKTGHSEIDATLETRWKRVLEAIGANPEAWQTP